MRRRAGVVARLALAVLAAACGEAPGGFQPDAAAVADNNRGVGLMGSFDYEGAHAVFAELAARHPSWLDARVNLAIATLNRQQEGDEAEALGILDAVLAEDPDHLRAHYCSGLLRLYLGEAEAAARHFRRVAEADPDDAYAAYYLGQSLSELGRREEALAWYQRAVDGDPYLRSAVFATARTLQALGRVAEAARHFEDYQRLEGNPQARLAEFKYTRMGPRGAARAFDAPEPAPQPRPAGALFAPGERVAAAASAADGIGLTAVDLAGDGRVALFAPGAGGAEAPNLLLRAVPGGAWQADPEHPLARIDGVRAAAWGDWDNDGLVDAYLLRRGANQLWHQTAPGRWRDVTAATETAAGDLDSVDGAFLDADHDGDLDLFVVNADGPDELLNNDRDGSFRPLAVELGLGGGARASRSFVPADLDADRDLDLLVVHAEPPHEVFANDRLWQYRPAPGFDALRAAPIAAAVAGDADADGRIELYTLDDAGLVSRWTPDAAGDWSARTLARARPAPVPQLALLDVTGEGRLALLHSAGDGVAALTLDDAPATLWEGASVGAPAGWAPVVRDAEAGPALAVRAGDGLDWLAPGPGRHRFAAFAFSGREDRAQSMRSNASGLGTRASVRVGSRWTVAHQLRSHSGPGQSLQPLAVGLGGAARVDFVAIDWSDGVFQSELGLEPGLHRLTETQRQLSSCPVLFAWDGDAWTFVSDVLGVGGIGQALAPGVYATPRPWENFLLPAGLPVARDGRHRILIAQMMEEVAYLDAARLAAYDLPPGWQLVLDERMAGGDPAPTGAARFYRRERLPAHARNDRGEDVTGALARADGRAAPLGALDARFVGLLAGEHVLTLDFGEPLGAAPGEPLLVIDGWVEYPYSQTAFAAWQAGRRYRSLTLEVRAADGSWSTLLPELGYPAGMPRRMSVPLPALPPGATALRLRTNQQIYLDRVAVAWAEPGPAIAGRALPLVAARVVRPGFALRVDGPQRRPGYDFAVRRPFWDTRHPAGFYTRFGPADGLVARTDDALAVFGPGEAVRLEFEASVPPPPGHTRRYVLETNGWAKDMDLYTRSGGRVEPLPAAGRPGDARKRLHPRYNTRYESGR